MKTQKNRFCEQLVLVILISVQLKLLQPTPTAFRCLKSLKLILQIFSFVQIRTQSGRHGQTGAVLPKKSRIYQPKTTEKAKHDKSTIVML